MDVGSVTQAAPAAETPRAAHGGGHAKGHAETTPAGPGVTVHISEAARLAAQRAAQEAAERARANKDAPKKGQPDSGAPKDDRGGTKQQQSGQEPQAIVAAPHD